MQPADIAVALRRRSPWEAMDLGLSMLQRWWRLAYAPHLVVLAVAAAIAVAAGLALERPWVALLLLWWAKPASDCVVLHVLSRAVFGERLGVRAALAQSPLWLGTLVRALFLRPWPDFARSLYLPVRQLEGQRGAAARARRSQLGLRVHGYAVWLTAACVIFEWLVLYLSFNLAAGLLVPGSFWHGSDFASSFFSGDFWTWDDVAAYALAVALLEPFYAAAGFALYLNRRNVLEAWDVEVALRRIAERHAPAATALLLCVFAGLAFLPAGSIAQEAKDPRREIAEVVKSPEFPHEREVMEWQPRNPSKREGGLDLSWLGGIGYALANVARVVFWVAAGAGLAYLLWRMAALLPQRRAPAVEPYRPPDSLFGMALAPETLPDDVGAAAAALAAQGRLREALGLLYRGALSHLVHRRGVMLLASHTEGEVLSLSPGESKSYLSELVSAWRACAYARRSPEQAAVERLAQSYKEFAT